MSELVELLRSISTPSETDWIKVSELWDKSDEIIDIHLSRLKNSPEFILMIPVNLDTRNSVIISIIKDDNYYSVLAMDLIDRETSKRIPSNSYDKNKFDKFEFAPISGDNIYEDTIYSVGIDLYECISQVLNRVMNLSCPLKP